MSQVFLVPEAVSTDLGNCKVIQVLPEDTKNTERALDLIAISFAGTETTAPEGGIDWCVSPIERAGSHFEPLDNAPSEERSKMVKWIAVMTHTLFAKYGTVFLLEDKETGEAVAATVCAPPIKDLHKDSIWTTLKMGFKALQASMQLGMVTKLPWIRLLSVMETIKPVHERVAKPAHLYIAMFATSPTAQGKGYGKKFLLFLAELADEWQTETYLEATGPRNVGFYAGVAQYETKEKVAMKHGKHVFDDYGGIHAMIRLPKQK